MSYRTTIVLDDQSRRAARELALRYDSSLSEAIRMAVVRHRDAVLGVPPESRRQRSQALQSLFELFEGNDPKVEVARLKAEDEGF